MSQPHFVCDQGVADCYRNLGGRGYVTRLDGSRLSDRDEGAEKMSRAIATVLLLALAIPLSGCVVEGPGRGPGYCYYHPYRCR